MIIIINLIGFLYLSFARPLLGCGQLKESANYPGLLDWLLSLSSNLKGTLILDFLYFLLSLFRELTTQDLPELRQLDPGLLRFLQVVV